MDGWMDGWMDVDDGRWMLRLGAVARASIAIDRGRVMMMMMTNDAWWWCLDLWVVLTHGAGFRRHTRARGCACA